VEFLSKRTGYSPDQELNLKDKKTLLSLTNAIAERDSGARYPNQILEKAYALLNR